MDDAILSADAAEANPTAETTMGQLVAWFPGARRALFARYHIGGCSSCGFSPNETLGAVCGRNGGLDVAEVIEHVRSAHEQDLRMLVSAAELRDRRGREEVELVDIRTREEFEAVRIAGSRFFTQELMGEMLARWDRGRPVVLVDHLGTRSLDAAAYLAGQGFRDVRALRGGIDAWSREVDPALPRYRLE